MNIKNFNKKVQDIGKSKFLIIELSATLNSTEWAG
jgi:hypothetical protein